MARALAVWTLTLRLRTSQKFDMPHRSIFALFVCAAMKGLALVNPLAVVIVALIGALNGAAPAAAAHVEEPLKPALELHEGGKIKEAIVE